MSAAQPHAFQPRVTLPQRLGPAALALLLWALVCAALAGFWWYQAQPTPLAAVPEMAVQDAPLDCLSYAPFRFPDASPLIPGSAVTRARIEADLRLLRPLTRCVRTYGISQGLDQVPAVARELGMRVKLGLWLGRDPVHNQAEIERGVALANANADVVDLLIVGNEVLLRHELTPEQLARALRQARAGSRVPVSYADVWAFWQRNAALADEVDVVGVHILPYWEDQPVAIEQAAAYVIDTAGAMRQLFAGKPVWVAETGWPAVGRQRGPAVPGALEQARFVRELLVLLAPTDGQVNWIEAFDQPWKRAFEGAMGAGWGFFSADGVQRVRFTGPVPGDRVAQAALLGLLVGGGVGGVLAILLAALKRRAWLEYLHAAPVAAVLVSMTVFQWHTSQTWDRTPLEQALSAVLALLSAAAAAAFAWPRAPLRTLVGLHTVLMYAAACAALVLWVDPRYRPLALWWFWAPTVAIGIRVVVSRVSRVPLVPHTPMESVAKPLPLPVLGMPCAARRRLRFLAAVTAVCALGFALGEGLANAQALAYAGVLLALAASAVIWSVSSPTQAAAASSSAGAAHSAA
jgi:exo-beta-1,3-glucanase (GH17 family)